ncbi:MAG TPA: gluconokinase, partial [Candidatus Acidoferrales bacterium]|nr:gluconokinase [Candidatus Acidoferrales bacterium]
MEAGVLVGIDLGTSAVKVLACTPTGKAVASAAASHPLQTPHPDWVEQDADAVYRAAMKALRDVLDEVRLRGDEVRAISFSCAMHGVLPVDARGEPLGPLITWMDRRSASVAQRWSEDGTGAELYALTGAPMHPMLPSCKLRWLAQNDAHLFTSAAKFISVKELFIFRWTGEWLVDWGLASATGLFDLRRRLWSERALEAAGVDASRLSEPVPPSTVRRSLRSPVASALGIGTDCTVVLGSSDGALANLGVGAVGDGEVAVTLGTSGAIRVVVDEVKLDAHGRTFCYCFDDRRYISGGPTSSAGAVLNALHALFLPEVDSQQRFERAVALAQPVAAGANGVTILPFLSGERAPYWLAELRGAIVGLDLSHTRAEILRAGFESVVLALLSVYEVMAMQPHRIRLSGGLTHA